LQRIFEPFFTTKTGPARRGLGMFIVQSIVENHKGRVRVAAKNGGADGRTGLIFTLEFPLPARKPEAIRPIPLLEAELPAEESWMLAVPAHLSSLGSPLALGPQAPRSGGGPPGGRKPRASFVPAMENTRFHAEGAAGRSPT
jgi:hypothetical protein